MMQTDRAYILLVDDEQAIIDMLRILLTKEGFQHIDTANTAEEALHKCQQHTYHLIVLDVMLPGPASDPYLIDQWLTATIRQTFIHKNSDHLTFIYPEQPIHITLYQPWLERIVINLASNAYRHNSDETKLVIQVKATATTDQHTLSITFTDNGGGLDEQTKLRLFERYYRGTNTNETTHGSGLGMAIAKQLTEALGGSIHVHSHLHQGTEVTLLWTTSTNVHY